ncbi:MAG: hypothetical protein U1E97_09710 [Alphaproteobacteria bacterium]
MAVFSAGRLDAKEIDRAFPLVSAGASDLTLSAWRRYAGRLLADQPPGGQGTEWPKAGIVVARSKDSYIHGLFSYRVVEDLRTGPTVCANDFVALGLLHRAEAISTLVNALEAIATAHGCAHMHVHLPESRIIPLSARDSPSETEGSVLRALQAHGFRSSSVQLERHAPTHAS